MLKLQTGTAWAPATGVSMLNTHKHKRRLYFEEINGCFFYTCTQSFAFRCSLTQKKSIFKTGKCIEVMIPCGLYIYVVHSMYQAQPNEKKTHTFWGETDERRKTTRHMKNQLAYIRKQQKELQNDNKANGHKLEKHGT